MAVSFVNDISKRKKIEDDMLIERSQLRSILEFSPLLASIKDLSGRIILANQSMADFLERDKKDLIGKDVFDHLPPDVAERVWQKDQGAMRSKEPIRDRSS